MLDLLVVSHACFTAINRNIYTLFQADGWQVELVIPKTLQFPSVLKTADPAMPGDPPLHLLPLVGNNPRTYQFDGLIDLLEQKKPAIILLDNDPVSNLALILGGWCKKNNASLYCISCENLPLGLLDTIKRRGISALAATVYKRTLLFRTKALVKGVFTINSDGKKIFQKEGYRNVQQMPLGFDTNYFYPDDHKRESLRGTLALKHLTFAYFGRLTKEKGIHLMIAALGNLKQYQWHLLMDHFDASATEYTQQISELLLQAGIMDRVIFVSPSHFEIAGYMNAVDVIVVPSVSVPNWKEQYGRVAAEALACGRLVVASDSGALPDLTGGYATLFPEGDVENLKSQLEKLLQRDFRAKYSAEQIADYAREHLSMLKQKEIMQTTFAAAQ
jgi:glycosyltransferase involved in cell wall biosynthesis